MKADVLTLAIIVFVVGVLITALNGVVFQDDAGKPPSALQRGVVVAQK